MDSYVGFTELVMLKRSLFFKLLKYDKVVVVHRN